MGKLSCKYTIQRVESGGRVIPVWWSKLPCVYFLPNGILRGRGRIKYIDFSTLNIHTVITWCFHHPRRMSNRMWRFHPSETASVPLIWTAYSSNHVTRRVTVLYFSVAVWFTCIISTENRNYQIIQTWHHVWLKINVYAVKFASITWYCNKYIPVAIWAALYHLKIKWIHHQRFEYL